MVPVVASYFLLEKNADQIYKMAAGFHLDKDDAIYKYHVRMIMMTITKKSSPG